ncbi:MAG: hypothetical protein LQ350_001549 [Teloschistes chrysophthalmus]|nr:MAG: hypothetical protein LQ350_001549 [Niorma chrysophthalma]
MYDTLSWYREWAINEGFALIDVNFPNHHYDIDDMDSLTYDKEAEIAKRDRERAELAIYLWENYIEPNDASPIYFVGVGSPCKEIVHILNNRDTFYTRLSTGGIALFIPPTTTPLPAIHDANTYYLSKWYKQNSLIFVANSHPIFHQDNNKKPSKRFGNLVRSSVGGEGGDGEEGEEGEGEGGEGEWEGEGMGGKEGGVQDMLECHRGDFATWVRGRMAALAGGGGTGRGRGRG